MRRLGSCFSFLAAALVAACGGGNDAGAPDGGPSDVDASSSADDGGAAGSDSGTGVDGRSADGASTDGSAADGNAPDGGDGAAMDGANDDDGSADGANGADGSADGATACGACATPPNACVDGSHVRVYDGPGCVAGACVFPSHVESCPDGCAGGACQASACSSVTCTAPPATCTDATTRRTFSSSCVVSGCQVTHADESCANGCASGACLPPGCAGTTCGAPPAATCSDPQILRGSAPIGTCSGTCSYGALTTWCSQGCLAGKCDAGSWTAAFMPTTNWTTVAFAVDGAGRPHAVFADGSGNVTWRRMDETGWRDQSVDTNLGSGVQVSLALDAGGAPLVAYFEPTNHRLRHARLVAGAFVVDEVTTSSGAGQNPAIAVDAGGVEWIAFDDTSVSPNVLRVAHGHAGAWSFEAVGSDPTGVAQAAFDPAGVLHVVSGPKHSNAVPSGGFYQPPAYHSKRVGGAWQVEVLDPNGLVFPHGMTFAANGDVLILYGVVGPVGRNDEARLRREGAITSDALVRTLSNWLDIIGAPTLYDGARDLKIAYADGTAMVRSDGEFWRSITLDLPPSPRILDVQRGPDGEPRFFASLSPNTVSHVSGYAYVTPTACVPSCTGAACGSDGCGGVCGTCGAGKACGPDRQCSAWHESTVNLPRLTQGQPLAFGLDARGGHHLLVTYDFPEHYYTSGSTQDEIFYMTDSVRPWDLPELQVVVGIPSGSFAQARIVPSSVLVSPAGAPEAVLLYGLQGTTWSLQHSTPAAGAWKVDWSNASGANGGPQLLGAARNAAGVTYTVSLCGAYPQLLCVTRSGAGQPMSSNYVGDYAQTASVAVDSAGHAHVLWTRGIASSGGQITSTQLEYATDAGGAWVSTPIPGQTTTASYDVFTPAIALAPDDTVHIAFRDTSSALRHGARAGGAFTLDTVGTAGSFALAVDPAGIPAFVNIGGPQAVAFARWSGGGWVQETIPALSASGAPWLGFDAAGKPHVFFVDGQLRLAYRP